MARLFILFLVALLPLRGWTAERMVFPIAQGVVQAAIAAEHDEASAMPSDCALHMQMAEAAHHAAADGDKAHHAGSGCESCQLCMPLAAAADLQAPALPAGPQAQPTSGSSRFASAEPAPSVKPPIS